MANTAHFVTWILGQSRLMPISLLSICVLIRMVSDGSQIGHKISVVLTVLHSAGSLSPLAVPKLHDVSRVLFLSTCRVVNWSVHGSESVCVLCRQICD